MNCKVGGCDGVVKTQGFCRRHYERVRTTGDPGPCGKLKPGPKPEHKKCAVKDCGRARSSRIYCRRHWYHFEKYGDPTYGERTRREGCRVEWCDREHWARGFCSGHYDRLVRYGDPLRGSPVEDRIKVPAAPLVPLLDFWLKRHGSYDLLTELTGISAKTLSKYRERIVIDFYTADSLLTAMHRSVDEVYGLELSA